MKSILVIDTPKSCSKCELFTCKHLLKIQMEIIKENNNMSNKEIKKQSHKQAFETCPLQDTTELFQLVEDNYEYIVIINGIARGISKKCFKTLQEIQALGGQDD